MFLALVFTAVVLYVASGIRTARKHAASMRQLKHRIHVNGIRGKSSVTRLIAASLREGSVPTLAKTTGTAARIIVDHEQEISVKRREADIAEQKRILDLFKGDEASRYKAVVFECMAINPIYQKYLEEKIMHSTIGVITNVREDHTDLLGTTLPEIARSLTATIPKNGHLVTAEANPELLDILQNECRRRGTVLHAVDTASVSDSQIAKFNHFEYKPNVAIALKVAELVGIDANLALQGMQKARPDPGAFVLKKFQSGNKVIHWANLFAINDRESFVITTDALNAKVGAAAKKAVILNNRHDRPERVAQFVDIALNSLQADYVFTFGDYESRVRSEIKKIHPNSNAQVISLGNSSEYKNSSGDIILDKIVSTVDHECILYGAVNIHTKQALALLSKLEGHYAH